MSKIDLDELERLAKAATSGPWVDSGLGLIRPPKKTSEFVAHCAPIVIHSIKKLQQCKANAAYIVAACNAVPELIAKVRELERQRDFLLMRGKTPACLLCDDCSYLVGEPNNWGCTAKLEIRKKCLKKAVERTKGATATSVDVDSEQAAKEAGE